ncbi:MULTISPECIES: GNAT family protein [unclassified Beijerinckia]|uniref:GNAT family N-acetyltransferase n=1 Tax=unclassified Beijerinckia TaxID=2638183 RepID=UPI000898598D|nr:MULTISPECIES: GNAT family protein [unclassified Beijerinckia]MDH7793968.1 RimJ/RimL family protein N-acetyltransferase [Beijerinckia sp. GAS462]SEB50480.1 Protein N-acetyltransferase, RimJ/RimL family [Beijerinckia sp. 28-YEA-48]
MDERLNEFQGRFVTLEPINQHDADDLFAALAGADLDDLCFFMADRPSHDREAFTAFVSRRAMSKDRRYFVCIPTGGKASGFLSFMRDEPAHRVIEIGDVFFAPPLQRSAAATEAVFLMARHAFETLHYRRLEWKCDKLNAPSYRAAQRFGFTYEGLFRQHMLVHGKSRDTAWFSMLDSEWPARKAVFERWLDPANFDAQGQQREALGVMMAKAIPAT